MDLATLASISGKLVAAKVEARDLNLTGNKLVLSVALESIGTVFAAAIEGGWHVVPSTNKVSPALQKSHVHLTLNIGE